MGTTSSRPFRIFVGQLSIYPDKFKRANSLAEIIPTLTQPTLIEVDYEYVVQGTKEVFKELESFDVKKIINGGLIIEVDSMDKRSKVYKKYKSYVTETQNKPPVDPTYQFRDSVLELNTDAIQQLEELLRTGENGVKLLRMLYYAFREAAIVLDAPHKYPNKWRANQILDICALSLEQLLECIIIINSADHSVMTGRRSAEDAIKVTVLVIMSKRYNS